MNYKIYGAAIPAVPHARNVLQPTRSCKTFVDSTFLCFVFRDPQVCTKLYKTLVIPKLKAFTLGICGRSFAPAKPP